MELEEKINEINRLLDEEREKIASVDRAILSELSGLAGKVKNADFVINSVTDVKSLLSVVEERILFALEVGRLKKEISEITKEDVEFYVPDREEANLEKIRQAISQDPEMNKILKSCDTDLIFSFIMYVSRELQNRAFLGEKVDENRLRLEDTNLIFRAVKYVLEKPKQEVCSGN